MSECCPRRYVEAGGTVLLRTSCNAQCYVTPAMGYAVAGYAVAGYARVDYPVAPPLRNYHPVLRYRIRLRELA